MSFFVFLFLCKAPAEDSYASATPTIHATVWKVGEE